MKISIGRVTPNRFNPNSLSEDQYDLLKKDIGEHGLDYPIEVRPLEDGSYEIIDGEHRWKACRELGFEEVECEVKDIDEPEAKQRNYRLNSARGTIDPLKEARLFQSEIESGMTQQEVAEKYGRSQQFISSRLVLFRLPERVKRKITTRVVTPSHGELLARLPDEKAVENLTQRVVKKKLSVPVTEKWVKWYAKLEDLKEKYPDKKDDVTAHRKVIERKDSDFPSLRSLESLEWRMSRVAQGKPTYGKDKYDFNYWSILWKRNVEMYRGNPPPRETLFKFLSGEDSYMGGCYYDDALVFYDSSLTLKEKIEKMASSEKGDYSYFWAYIEILADWYGVSESEVEECLKSETREKTLRRVMEHSWEEANRHLSYIMEYNFRHEDFFETEIELFEEYYENYCFACRELGVQPAPKPRTPAWRDPAYVDVYTLRIYDLFMRKLVSSPWGQWVLKHQRGFLISEVASALEEDLKFLKAQESN